MTVHEQKMVLELANGVLPKSEFLRRFRHSADGSKLVADLLREALEVESPDDVEYALIVGFVFGFTLDHLKFLLQLVSKPWHFKHEDVVTALGQLASPEAVEGLYSATKWIPDYLDYDESRALAVKAIWALGRITGKEVDEILNKLAEDPDAILAEAAKEQVRRR